jgi:hypothetical protein
MRTYSQVLAFPLLLLFYSEHTRTLELLRNFSTPFTGSNMDLLLVIATKFIM